MNNKEIELYRILDAVISCCATQIDEQGTMSITRDDVLGRNRAENAVMTRCVLAEMVVMAGYSITTLAQLLHRTQPAVRHLLELSADFRKTSRAYRIAEAEATIMCKDIG